MILFSVLFADGDESPACPDAASLDPDPPPPDTESDSSEQLRRRLLFVEPRVTSSSSSSSSLDSDDDTSAHSRDSDADSDKEVDQEGEEGEEEDEAWPKDPWSPLPSLFAREVGAWRHCAAQSFQIKCGASLNFVRRLERSRKLDHHQGCVNALHFNRSGLTALSHPHPYLHPTRSCKPPCKN